MAADLAFRCSEKETLLVAAGKTMAVDKYRGVINKLATTDPNDIRTVMITIGFLFAKRKRSSVCLLSAKSGSLFSIDNLILGEVNLFSRFVLTSLQDNYWMVT
jgi:hypothetical protein